MSELNVFSADKETIEKLEQTVADLKEQIRIKNIEIANYEVLSKKRLETANEWKAQNAVWRDAFEIVVEKALDKI